MAGFEPARENPVDFESTSLITRAHCHSTHHIERANVEGKKRTSLHFLEVCVIADRCAGMSGKTGKTQ